MNRVIAFLLLVPAAVPLRAEVVDHVAFRSVVQPFFAKHCNSCHGEDKAEADLRLDQLGANFGARASSGHWIEVLDRINLGEMPPEGEPKPDPDDLARVTNWITVNLQEVRRTAESTGGRVVMRRLSRLEYTNTVRDLLGVEFVQGEGPMEDLPPDGSIQGFDRLSKALLVDPSLFESYLQVGRDVAERAVVFRPPLVPTKTQKFNFVETNDSAMKYLLFNRSHELSDPFLVVMNEGARTFAKLKHPANQKEVPVTGRYRIRVKAAADPGLDERGDPNEAPVYMDVTYGSLGRLARFRVDATKEDPQVYEFIETLDESVPGEFGIRLVDQVRFTSTQQVVHHLHRQANELVDQGNFKDSLRLKARMRAEGTYDSYVRGGYSDQVIDTEPLPKLYVQWIEVTGPLQPDFPPPSMKLLFPDGLPAEEQKSIETARQVIEQLLPRAFRRRATPSEVDEVVALIQADLERGATFEQALETGIAGVLCSPSFLFLQESESRRPRKLSSMELATRLSYFLWSSKPDDILFRSASTGKLLDDPEELDRQIDRMIKDGRSEGFVDGFARQWLKVDEFTRFPPDERIFPDFYRTEFAGIANDLANEPLAFFREVLQRDEPIGSFLNSNWLMLNERLAAYYEIEGVHGDHFRRVALKPPRDWLRRSEQQYVNIPRVGPLHAIGPFPAENAEEAFATDFGFESHAETDLDAEFDGVRWTRRDEWADGEGHMVLNEQNSAHYLYRTITSNVDQDLRLALGSDDAIKVWLNGEEVHRNYVMRSLEARQERITVSLQKGENHLLIKIVNGGGEGGFFFEADTVGQHTITAIRTEPTKRTAAQKRILEALYLSQSPSGRRGGLLGMAGIHLWGADGNRTKPVERGKYLLTVLFNDPPPPPPPNAGEVEPNLRGQQLTVRERLELHREQATCNNCHRRIDPYGLALENFNAIGRWREQVDGEKPVNQYWGDRAKIDPRVTMPNGDQIRNFLQFKQAIMNQDERFARGLIEKLLTYALGRTIEPSDRTTINSIIDQRRTSGLTLRDLIKGIAHSTQFQTK